MNNDEKWVTSFDQVAPPNVIELLRVPPQRMGIIAYLLDSTSGEECSGERWLGAPAVAVYDGGDIEAIFFDSEGTVVVRAPWPLWFIEAWTSELDEGVDASDALASLRAAIEAE